MEHLWSPPTWSCCFVCFCYLLQVTPGGVLASVLCGSILRAILEYALPKDGLLAIPHGKYNFDYGAGQVCHRCFVRRVVGATARAEDYVCAWEA